MADFDLTRIGNHAPKAARADIVFIHGLGDSTKNCWRGLEDESTFWPDLLSEDFPACQFWAVDHPADRVASVWSGPGMNLLDRAAAALDLMVARGLGERPLVFVAHSLGGLVAKCILRTSSDSGELRKRSIFDKTVGVVFLATPHDGSGLATAIERIPFLRGLRSKSVIELSTKNENLQGLGLWYKNRIDHTQTRTKSYYETQAHKGVMVVPRASADPGVPYADPVPTDRDHVSIAKISSRNDTTYISLTDFLKSVLRGSRSNEPLAGPVHNPSGSQTEGNRHALSRPTIVDGPIVSPTAARSDAIPLNQEIVDLDEKANEALGIESFQYSRRKDHFLGRRGLVDRMLSEFLDFEAPFNSKTAFRWTLVHGAAGIGKSRFALEVLRAVHKEKASLYPQRYWGFVKRDRTDASQSLSEQKVNAWIIDGPAFLVLDYAGTNRDLVTIIGLLKARAILLEQPIRLMLLERRSDSGRVADLDRIDAEESFLRDTCYRTEEMPEGQGIGIQLEPLDDASIVQIMRNRVERERGFLKSVETDDYLLRRLDDINDGERRPLFAAMVASAIAGEDTSAVAEDSGTDRLRKRSATLRYLIRRERDKYWRKDSDGSDLLDLGQHENLLALATFTRGLDFTVLDDAPGHPTTRLPGIESFEAGRYSRMATSGQQNDLFGTPIGFLEPDFIGEWFVLSRLSPEARLEPNVPVNRPARDDFVGLAWKHGRERAAQFVRQCHQNYPDEVRRLGYLLPPCGQHIEHVIQLLRDMILDWRRELALLSDESHEFLLSENAGIICERAEEVFRLLRQHVDAAPELSDLARDDIADATESYVFIQCWSVSPSVRSRTDDRFETQISDQEGKTGRSLISSSHRIQKFLQDSSLASAVEAELADPTRHSALGDRAFSLVDRYSRQSEAGTRSEQLMQRHSRSTERDDSDLSGARLYELAAKLLNDAASFFRSLGDQNEPLREQMTENADVFAKMAALLLQDPGGNMSGNSHAELAGRLLQDSAMFFRTLADQNEPIAEQMYENAQVYEEIGRMVIDNPYGILDEN